MAGSPPSPAVSALPDISAEDRELIESVSFATMTSIERRYHLVNALRYLTKQGIAGAVVECGVWRGGSMMLAAKVLNSLGAEERDLYLCDTFAGMPPPQEVDIDFSGVSASQRLKEDEARRLSSDVWAISSLGEVQRNMISTGYPAERMYWVQGSVEQTLPHAIPGPIALLRLDTDWYASTKHELETLWPQVTPGGVVIVDDYGHWRGARQAVDEFIAASSEPILLHRLDETGRAFVKLQ
ncbi:MAG: TylF/MycF/NovP-related O-methyltransferase [Verrucomicrobiaceae bacterium]